MKLKNDFKFYFYWFDLKYSNQVLKTRKTIKLPNAVSLRFGDDVDNVLLENFLYDGSVKWT